MVMTTQTAGAAADPLGRSDPLCTRTQPQISNAKRPAQSDRKRRLERERKRIPPSSQSQLCISITTAFRYRPALRVLLRSAEMTPKRKWPSAHIRRRFHRDLLVFKDRSRGCLFKHPEPRGRTWMRSSVYPLHWEVSTCASLLVKDTHLQKEIPKALRLKLADEANV